MVTPAIAIYSLRNYNQEDAANALAEELQGKRCLITTRTSDVLPSGTNKVEVDAMRQAEAVSLLASGLEMDGNRGKCE